jgi:hypothetical protein
MRHGQTMRNSARAFFTFAALAIVSACSDQNTAAPASEAPTFIAPANFARVGNVISFRVNNNEGATQRLGNHLISIPAGAICQLAKSGYGPTEWDKPCSPLKGSIVITAQLLEDADGMPFVDFQPAMRFAPSKEVVLFLRQGRNTAMKELILEYCNNVGYCTDESLTDPSLKPFRIGKTPVVGRRLKHFSGYMMGSGDNCTGTFYSYGDGTGWCEDGGFTRRSGYMVASGEDVSDVLNDKDKDSDKKKDEQ